MVILAMGPLTIMDYLPILVPTHVKARALIDLILLLVMEARKLLLFLCQCQMSVEVLGDSRSPTTITILGHLHLLHRIGRILQDSEMVMTRLALVHLIHSTTCMQVPFPRTFSNLVEATHLPPNIHHTRRRRFVSVL